MTSSPSFLEYVMDEVLAGVSRITSRAMFGEDALYRHGVIFGIIADNILYFKVNDANWPDLKGGLI